MALGIVPSESLVRPTQDQIFGAMPDFTMEMGPNPAGCLAGAAASIF